MSPVGEKAFAGMQYLLPKRMISRLFHRLTRIRAPWFKNIFIRVFCRLFDVDMSDAENSNATSYQTFNTFFTRALRPETRPMADDASRVVCPVDGTVSQAGRIEGEALFQAKGKHYTLQALLGEASDTEPFRDGDFATIYLAPYDYHRIHMPVSGRLRSMRYVPGQLFSVNQATARQVDNLFARNERVVCQFETDFGPLALIMVGALIVGSMETTWAGEVAPRKPRQPTTFRYDDATPSIARGDEMGRFNMGSTVILLTPPGRVAFDPTLSAGATVRLRQTIGNIVRPA